MDYGAGSSIAEMIAENYRNTLEAERQAVLQQAEAERQRRRDRARANWNRVRNVVFPTEEEQAARRAANMREVLRNIRNDMNRQDGVGGGSLINSFLPNHQQRVSNISNLISR